MIAWCRPVAETFRTNVITDVVAVMEGCHEGWVLHHQVARNQPDTGTKVNHQSKHNLLVEFNSIISGFWHKLIITCQLLYIVDIMLQIYTDVRTGTAQPNSVARFCGISTN